MFTHKINYQTALFQKTKFRISYLFELSLNVKQFYFTLRWDPSKCYHSGREWNWHRRQWSGTPHSSKLKHYWSLTITLSNVMNRTLVGWGSYHSSGMTPVYSTAPNDWACNTLVDQIMMLKTPLLKKNNGGAHGVKVIVTGYGHGNSSSNPGPDCISHNTNTLGKGMNPNILPSAMVK